MAKKFFDILPPKQITAQSEKKIAPIKIGQARKNKSSVFRPALILLILISIGAFFYFYLSQAEAEIWPETKDVNFNTEVAVDEKTGEIEPIISIPGKFIEEEKESSKEFSATGVAEKKEYAEGKIRVHNDSQKSVTLIKNSHFLSDEGKQFHSLKEITIPAKGYIDAVDVEADGPGEEYNIGPSKFSAPNLRKYSSELFYNIWAESLAPMKGGFLGKLSRITDDDLKNAENDLLEKLLSSGKDSLKISAGDDYVLLDDLLKQEVVDRFPLAKSGQEVKSFIFKAKIKTTAFVFRKTDLEKFSRDFIYSQMEENKKLVEKSLNLNYAIKEKDLTKGKIVLTLEIKAKIYSEPDFKILKEKIKGKTAIEGEYSLEKEPGILKAKINLWPFWVKQVPKSDEKIKVRLNID